MRKTTDDSVSKTAIGRQPGFYKRSSKLFIDPVESSNCRRHFIWTNWRTDKTCKLPGGDCRATFHSMSGCNGKSDALCVLRALLTAPEERGSPVAQERVANSVGIGPATNSYSPVMEYMQKAARVNDLRS